jgi:mono/diheme cytochrome c family protein
MSARGWLNPGLSLVLLALLVLSITARRQPTVPNVEFLPEMVRTTRFNAYTENPYFADGKTLQSPAPGTIARGQMPLNYTRTDQDALRAGRELANPFTLEEGDAMARGETVYRHFCLPCHGATGAGDGPVVRRGYPAPPPPNPAVHLSDGQMFHIVTYGKGNMAGYAAQISREDRWRVILFVRSVQQKQEQQAEAAATVGGAQ